MKVFISWSGAQSKTVAEKLKQWIPDVLQSVEPWFSGADIDAGERWNERIAKELADTNFGIICLTPTNLTKPWILFETGALAKALEKSRVCPYLINLEPNDRPAGPLSQFQAKRANEKETFELIATMNKSLTEGALPNDRLERVFQKFWPDLEATLQSLPTEDSEPQKQRSTEDMIAEILELARNNALRRAELDREVDEMRVVLDPIFMLMKRINWAELQNQPIIYPQTPSDLVMARRTEKAQETIRRTQQEQAVDPEVKNTKEETSSSK